MKIIDTHSHMYLPEFDDDRKACMARALEKNVVLTALPNIDSSTIEALRETMREFPEQTIGMMGLHPSSVGKDFENELKVVREELDSGGYHAVGEIGIDLYWDKTFLQEQIEAFGRQIDWALEKDLPIVIHARESFKEIFEVLDEKYRAGLAGVFHCFTGTEEIARKALSYDGFWLGIGGVATFKNSGLDKVLAAIGPERLVLETDAPYLAPHPHRGKRNETAFTAVIADKLAEIFSLPIERIAELTTANTRKLFRLNED